jgi:hypothetical protein
MAVSYWCSRGHETRPTFAVLRAEEIPTEWECARCGIPAGRSPDGKVDSHPAEGYKSHLDYVKERRSEADGAALLEAALTKLRQRRG